MILYGATGALAGSAANGTSVAPGYPTGITAGQMLVLIVAQKPTTAGGGTVTTPAGWTFVGSVLDKGGYGSTVGNAVGNSNVFWYTKVAVGSETGALTITVAASSVAVAGIFRFTTTSTGWDTPVLVSGDQTAEQVGSSISATTTSTLAMQEQDFLFGFIGTSTAISGAFNVLTASAPGLNMLTTKAPSEWFSTNGNDVGGTPFWAAVANGSGTAAVTLNVALTAAGSVTGMRGPLAILRLRENPVVLPTTERRLHTEQVEVLTGGTSSDRRLHTEQIEVLTGGPNADRILHTQVVEVLYARPPAKISTTSFTVAVTSDSASQVSSLFTYLATVITGPEVFVPVLSVWNGTTEVQATVALWNGTTEVPLRMDDVL